MHRIIFIFFFLSGFSSLVFEVLWERLLMQVFGSTTFAISTLLTAFMAGLALGSVIGGRVAAKIKRPLMVYGLLEGCIGLYGLLVPILLNQLPNLYGVIFNRYLEDFYTFSLLRFLAVFFILLIPTTLMGATLPIVSQWVAQREKLFEGSIGLLYGMNTLGACAGCFLAGFVILPRLGLQTTNLTFVIVNVALCVIVLLSRGRLKKHDEKREELNDDALNLQGVIQNIEPVTGWLRTALLTAFALSGLFSMSYQVLWTRAYVIVLGSSTYSFTVILVSFLIGLASGSAFISTQVKKMRRPIFWFALTQLGVCLTATLAFFFMDTLPELLFNRLRQSVASAYDVYAYNFFLVGLVVFLPTFLQGMAFPLVVRALVKDREGSGKSVGRIYAFNTAGAISGSFIAGFVLMPKLGLSKAITLIVGANLLSAIVLAVLEWRAQTKTQQDIKPGGRWLAVASIIALGVFVFAPSIDKVRLTRGLFRVYWSRELFSRKKLAKDKPELLFYKDGVAVTTSIERRGKLITLKGNGKAEASDGADMATQIMVGLLPFVFRSGHKELPIKQEVSIMVGYGSGVTAGGSLQWPLKHLEVIEIEEAMIKASTFFNHVNHKPLEDPRMKLLISDGRNYLEYTDKKYDVIVSEPSNPWIAGVASLFTVEHFKRARRHLKPKGIFGQWVQLYEMRPENVKTIFATFAKVFKHVYVFSSMPKGTDLILIGSESPIVLPADGFARAWAIDSVRKELNRAGLQDPHDLYGLSFMTPKEFHTFIQGAKLNTDDNGLLEFEAPKDVVRYDLGEKFFTNHYHKQKIYGDLRPYLENWGNPAVWTPQRIGKLARGYWRGGKHHMVDTVLKEAGVGEIQKLNIAPPFDALETVHLVRHAQKLDLHKAMIHLWPDKQSTLYATVEDAASKGKQTQAMFYLESQEKPKLSGYSGLKGLFYAYLLYHRRYFKHARWQLARLAKEKDPQVINSPLFHILDGHVKTKKMRYNDAYLAFTRAGAKLL